MSKNKTLAAAVLAVMFLTFSAGGGANGGKKEIEEKYRFSGGSWYANGSWVDETVTVYEDAIETSTGLFLAGVYTSGGGNYSKGSWAYLYDDMGKFGIIYTFEDSIYITLGKKTVSDKSGWHFQAGIKGINYRDMKNTINGKGIFGAAG